MSPVIALPVLYRTSLVEDLGRVCDPLHIVFPRRGTPRGDWRPRQTCPELNQLERKTNWQSMTEWSDSLRTMPDVLTWIVLSKCIWKWEPCKYLRIKKTIQDWVDSNMQTFQLINLNSHGTWVGLSCYSHNLNISAVPGTRLILVSST